MNFSLLVKIPSEFNPALDFGGEKQKHKFWGYLKSFESVWLTVLALWVWVAKSRFFAYLFWKLYRDVNKK